MKKRLDNLRIGKKNAVPLFQRMVGKFSVNEKTKCWEWVAALNVHGYGRLGFRGKARMAHRLMWAIFVGNPGQKSVLHRCDNPRCVNPDHLFLGTQPENVADMYAKGRAADLKGTGNGRAVLTEDDVIAIRASSKMNITIAAQYGVSPPLIAYIKKRKLWRHVQ